MNSAWEEREELREEQRREDKELIPGDSDELHFNRAKTIVSKRPEWKLKVCEFIFGKGNK